MCVCARVPPCALAVHCVLAAAGALCIALARLVQALRDAPRDACFQVQGSLDGFIKSAPEGLKRAAEAAIPVAKVVALMVNKECSLPVP